MFDFWNIRLNINALIRIKISNFEHKSLRLYKSSSVFGYEYYMKLVTICMQAREVVKK